MKWLQFFLIAIVMLVEVKQAMSLWWGLGGLLAFALLLMSAVRIYKLLQAKTVVENRD